MSAVAARNFGASASVIRPTSPYLKAPPLAHSTTSAMVCFLVLATRRATVRNSLRSWLNPGPAADPLPLLCAGDEAVLFLFSLRSKYVASSGRTVSFAVIPAKRPPVRSGFPVGLNGSVELNGTSTCGSDTRSPGAGSPPERSADHRPVCTGRRQAPGIRCRTASAAARSVSRVCAEWPRSRHPSTSARWPSTKHRSWGKRSRCRRQST
jgi:hypothetical protein